MPCARLAPPARNIRTTAALRWTRRGGALAALAVWSVAAAPAPAVLLADGDGSRNLAPPRDIPELLHVVDRSGFGAIYLERGWVLTARHVSAGVVNIGNASFEPLPGSLREFINPDGTKPDLVAYQIDPGAAARVPALAPLAIASRPPESGALVYLMGFGSNRGEPLRWSMGALGERRGWHWGSGSALRWGTNRVAGTGLTAPMGEWRSRVFSMHFGEPGSAHTTEHEATVAVGDSGGGVFTREDGRWVLCGVLVAHSTHPGQPAETAAFGNRILAVDLSRYRSQILALLADDASRRESQVGGSGAPAPAVPSEPPSAKITP